ncbi:chloride channel protein [Acidiferrimicrobium sp. IK]|uniref:chloride channel protein n=1 Tax=Acidiferrimicrobium sp. IK TaxID=2871700 RepID=UPI0021CB6859|nr:chloride channel protein [Acidiferrimicrobium sp. IK]MCU4183128.1 chloride channel protein [Acidiferrimicrobium sp. IK]
MNEDGALVNGTGYVERVQRVEREEDPADEAATALGDFTVKWRTVALLPLAVVVGAIAACVALGLLDLIGLFTHLAYYGTLGDSLVAPSVHRWGAWSVLIPVVGGLLVGVMARFGSEQIRGHGIPEAMETILIGGSAVQPRLAVLKPISSALSIGSGGPFGAEGPIILTGGAIGSVLAQLFRLAAIERRTLLVAGACAGMAGVFGTPVAAALFGVELLVFEWRPRSFVPIAVAVTVAEVVRDVFAAHHLMGPRPLFPVPPHGAFGAAGVGQAAVIGVAAGVLALVLTTACYGAEDLFKKLPIHWMWWPAIGGVVVGVGGMIDPKALGVGYSVIGDELAGKLAVGALVLLLVTKLVMWSVALGSGTSGGILAPLLMMGAAMGGVIGHAFGGSSATWALMGMAGALAGVTRSPFTSIVFAFELTHDTGSLLPLLIVCALAHLVSALILKRSILTEKVARKGFHVMREYAVDQLEAVFVREAMVTDLLTVSPATPAGDLRAIIETDAVARRQRLFPVIDQESAMVGVVGWADVTEHRDRPELTVGQIMHSNPVVAHAGETLRSAADRMAHHELGALPVVDSPGGRLVGVVTHFELLAGRRRQLIEERHRERQLTFRRLRRSAGGMAAAEPGGAAPPAAGAVGSPRRAGGAE